MWRKTAPLPSARAAGQRGLSLVELMVGIAIGLFIVAAASLVVSSQLNDSRRLLLEVQVQQDMRAAMDVVTREVRRSGSRDRPSEGVWAEGVAVSANAFGEITLHDGGQEVRFDYQRGLDPPNQLPYLAFRLDTSRGVLQSRIGGNWQDLTDGSTMAVTRFLVTAQAPVVHLVPCPRACDPANPSSTACWPRLRVRSYVVELDARARSDAAIARTLRSEVRVRNDRLERLDGTSAAMECPA